MFYFLVSLQNLLVQWATSANGRSRLASVPRNAALTAEINRLTAVGVNLTGSAPDSNKLAGALIAFLQ
jgi:hypothetical protein